MPHFSKLFLSAALVLILASGCKPSTPDNTGDLIHNWLQSDLLLIQSPSGPDPEHSIIAFYQRQQQSTLEFRLDLLDLLDPLSSDVYLAVDDAPGGTSQLPAGQPSGLQWDMLLVFPVSTPPFALGPDGQPLPGVVPRILRDPAMDTIILIVEKQALPGDLNQFKLQAFLTAPDSQRVLDQTPILTPGSSNPKAAPLLLAFNDSLPAATPVQALRRWDGAHTGPYGQRHGLSVLVEAASSHHIPISLLDLKIPASLSALELMGGTKKLRQLEIDGWVVLPENAYGDPAAAAVSLESSHQVAQAFGFRSSPVGYGAFPKDSLPPLKAFFYSSPDLNSILVWGGIRLFPLPRPELAGNPIATQAGLSLDFKRSLLAAALSPELNMVTAGGSLPASELADSSIAPLFFEYLAAHPWIKPLFETDLMQWPAKMVDSWPLTGCENLLCTTQPVNVPYNSHGTQIVSGLTDAQIREKIRLSLAELPPSTLKDQAYQAYFSLTEPAIDFPYYSAVQANYLGQVGYLLAAARWAQNPVPQSDCSQDLDWDGAPDCVLASPDLFAIICLDGGRLVFAGWRSNLDVVQWIGQKSQFAINWDNVTPGSALSGLASDPSEIPGAFFGPEKFVSYRPKPALNSLELLQPETGVTKLFTVVGSQLIVKVNSSQPYQTQIPLALYPPGRFSTGWSDRYPYPAISADSWTWQAAGQPGLTIHVDGASLAASSSLDSRATMNQPEIPDRANPPGHYLPFPMGVLALQSKANFEIRFSLSP